MIEELYEQLNRELLLWCTSLCGNKDLAQDLVQEAWLRALRNEVVIAQIVPGKRRAWMYRTVKNLWTDHVRKARFETLESASENESSPADPFAREGSEEQAYSQAEWQLVLSKLPPEEATILVMRYVMGYTSGQIAEVFSLSPATIRWRLMSARRHLREELGMNDERDQ